MLNERKSESFITHTDNRRTLYEWVENDIFKSAKVVVVHEEMPMGNHHHKNKDETFILLNGSFKKLQVGYYTLENVVAPFKVTIPRNTFHLFVCTPGSILLGVGSEPFDINDEIPGHPASITK
jgi:hypothetical protein